MVYEAIELNNVTLRKTDISYNDAQEIDVTDDSIKYGDFYEQYLFNNRPCIVHDCSVRSWISTNEWASKGLPVFPSLKFKYGKKLVPVADCGLKHYNVQKKSTTLFSDYLDYWEDYIKKCYPSTMPCLYLKDWHFTRDCPGDNVYRVPRYFASDWLNEYLTSQSDINDDYRFIYMGPKGSWTPLHADVFTSFSWSVNVSGRKKWLLFPPGQEKCLCDKYGNLAYDATNSDLFDKEQYPQYTDLSISYSIIQEAGEAIFIPSGWHHQVWNLEDTISINHNWINACNIQQMWEALKSNLVAVENEIQDCKDMEDWEEHCQIMLRSLFGINYKEFYKFLKFIAEKRVTACVHKKSLILFGDWELGAKHCLFDLKQCQTILQELLSDSNAVAVLFKNHSPHTAEELVHEIDKLVDT